jgi:hypothetical protein
MYVISAKPPTLTVCDLLNPQAEDSDPNRAFFREIEHNTLELKWAVVAQPVGQKINLGEGTCINL